MSGDAQDTVYCNAQMPMAQGRELSRLVAELRASGEHPGLDSVFEEYSTNSIPPLNSLRNSSLESVDKRQSFFCGKRR